LASLLRQRLWERAAARGEVGGEGEGGGGEGGGTLSRVTSHWARERGRRIGTGAAEQGAWSGEDGRTYQTWGSWHSTHETHL
jgi:hypothetical protein